MLHFGTQVGRAPVPALQERSQESMSRAGILCCNEATGVPVPYSDTILIICTVVFCHKFH